jgi:hypothetical protein
MKIKIHKMEILKLKKKAWQICNIKINISNIKQHHLLTSKNFNQMKKKISRMIFLIAKKKKEKKDLKKANKKINMNHISLVELLQQKKRMKKINMIKNNHLDLQENKNPQENNEIILQTYNRQENKNHLE